MKVVEFDNSQEHREAAKSLGLSFFSEAPHYASVKIDWERIYKTCMLPMSRGVFVYEGEQPAGFMLSLLSPNWYDTEVSGKDLALFVSRPAWSQGCQGFGGRLCVMGAGQWSQDSVAWNDHRSQDGCDGEVFQSIGL